MKLLKELFNFLELRKEGERNLMENLWDLTQSHEIIGR